MTTPNTLAEATDRMTNKITYRAMRSAHATFDENCCVLALNVSRAIATIDGGDA